MKNSNITFLFILFTLAACEMPKTNAPNANFNKTQRLYPPLDTAEIIKTLNIQESLGFNINYGIQLDTLELTSVAYACDCASWVVSSQWDWNYSEFNLAKYGYWIEPAHVKTKMPEYLTCTGNKVIFIGQELSEKKKPTHPAFGSNEEYKIFKYYGYKVLKPYKVYGPEIPVGDIDLDGDSLWQSLILEIN